MRATPATPRPARMRLVMAYADWKVVPFCLQQICRLSSQRVVWFSDWNVSAGPGTKPGARLSLKIECSFLIRCLWAKRRRHSRSQLIIAAI